MNRKRKNPAGIGIVSVVMASLCLLATPSWGQNAKEYYSLGLKSSLANKRIEYFTKALELNPNLAEAYEKRAVHYYFQGRLDAAIRDYTSAIKLKPHRAGPYRMRGLAHFKKAHGEGLKAEAKRLALMYGTFGVEGSREELQKAIDDFSRAIDLSPQLASGYSYRAEAYLVGGRVGEALDDCITAIKLGGNQQTIAKAYAVRARIYRRSGQNDLSQSDYYKSRMLDPYTHDYPPLHVPLISNYSGNADGLKTVSRIGLLIIFLLTLVVVFRLFLPVPKKGD